MEVLGNNQYLLSDRVKDVYQINDKTPCIFEYDFDPRCLLVPSRLDVAAKLYYINAREKGYNMEFPCSFFKEQVTSITEFTNSENGSDTKQTLDSFVTEFDIIIDSIKQTGFQTDLSLIPVSKDGVILDGAHRLACCIYFNIPIQIVRFPHVSLNGPIYPGVYDYKFFERTLLRREFLELMVQQYIYYKGANNIYLACFWPKSLGSEKLYAQAESILKEYPIIYSTQYSFIYSSFLRLISQVYIHDTWVGSLDNNFSGAESKAIECYSKNGKCRFILFEGGSKEDTLDLKERIRQIYGVGKHSIHITDSSEESLKLSDIVFNSNSRTFLSSSKKINLDKIQRRLNVIQNDDIITDVVLPLLLHGKDIPDSMINTPLSQSFQLKRKYTSKDLAYTPPTFFVYNEWRMFYPNKKNLDEYFVIKANKSLFIKDYRKRSKMVEKAIHNFSIMWYFVRKYTYLLYVNIQGRFN